MVSPAGIKKQFSGLSKKQMIMLKKISIERVLNISKSLQDDQALLS